MNWTKRPTCVVSRPFLVTKISMKWIEWVIFCGCWSEWRVYTALGRCRQNKVATKNSVFLLLGCQFSFVWKNGKFSELPEGGAEWDTARTCEARSPISMCKFCLFIAHSDLFLCLACLPLCLSASLYVCMIILTTVNPIMVGGSDQR